MIVINQKLYQECDELVTEEDSLNPEPPNHNTLPRHARQAILRKLLFFLSTARTMRSGQTSHGSQDVATPIWNSREIDWARLSTKKLCTAHQERWTTFARATAPSQQSLPNLVPLELVCTFFFFLKSLGKWETFLDHVALSGPRVQIGRTMSNWDPVAPFWPPSRASSIKRTVGFSAPPCCSQVPNRRSKRTIGNGTS